MNVVADPFFPLLKSAVIKATGMAFFADKDQDLAEVIGRRLETVGAADCAQYFELVTDPARGSVERDELVSELTIGETYFFRHPELFEAMRRTVLPDIIARNQSRRRLRIWSAGCATGAEPYSVAIMLRRDFLRELQGWQVQIVGTDINKRFLAAAKRGKYQNWALRTTSDSERERYFLSAERDAWVVKPEYRHGVTFRAHNLIADQYPSVETDMFDFDLILCRNVLIYFSRDSIRGVADRLHACLADGGWLLPGHAEPDTELFRNFDTVDAPGAVLYRRGPDRLLDEKAPWDDEPDWASPVDAGAAPTTMSVNLPATEPEQQASAVSEEAPVGALDRLRDLVDRGEWRRAMAVATELADGHAETASYFLLRGLIQQGLGRAQDAEASLRRAIYLDRRHALAHYCLGLVLREQGRPAAKAFANAGAACTGHSPDTPVPDGDGLTFGRLGELAESLRRLEEDAR